MVVAVLTVVIVVMAGPSPVLAAGDRRPGPLQTTTTATVRIRDLGFHPRRLEVAPGTTVRWMNRDSVTHTATSNTGIWASGRIAPGDSFSRVFSRAGIFRYRCTIHPNMTGRIVVG